MIFFFQLTKGKTNEWTLEYKGSPGNLIQFESILFSNTNEMVISTSVIGINLKVTGQQRVSIHTKYDNSFCNKTFYYAFRAANWSGMH